MSSEFLEKLIQRFSKIYPRDHELAGSILASYPSGLGFPSDVLQSSYYPGKERISQEEAAKVSAELEKISIAPENTRIMKSVEEDKVTYTVLQASVQTDIEAAIARMKTDIGLIRVVKGDHSADLGKVCKNLGKAKEYAANSIQESYLTRLIESFSTGDIEAYKDSQRYWVKDLQPSLETVFGFVEPYRDPAGIRAEFEGLAAIVNQEETQTLTELVKRSSIFIQRLPWAVGATENNGKGPFEKELFDNPDFTSLHGGFFTIPNRRSAYRVRVVAYCSSIIFPGINLPNV